MKRLLLILLCLPMIGFGQRVIPNLKIKNADVIRMNEHTNIPNYIKFKSGEEIRIDELENWLRDFYKSGNNYGIKLLDSHTDNLGFTHSRYQQIINSYPVELSMLIVHEKDGLINSINGDFYDDVNLPLDIIISEEVALEKALEYTGAEVYKWELETEESILKRMTNDPNATYFPAAELVIININGQAKNKLKLSYKFNIAAHKPFSHKDIYVDIVNGDIIWERTDVCSSDTTGTANTLYSGQQQITSSEYFGNYRLSETGRGNGINTYTCENSSTQIQTDIINQHPDWTHCHEDSTNSPSARAALDAHWGTEVTYDYFLNVHSRNSIDGYGKVLNSFVHNGNNYQNATYTFSTSFLTYGDGANNDEPWTVLPIVAHEVTHGVTHHSADLIYQGESGALNESFSDIFGATIDFTTRPAQADWLMGNEVLGTAFRNMADPNSVSHPNTYLGNFWADTLGFDFGGVHTNSSIQNLWYVLLVDGGSGVNDNGDSYNVNSIGLLNASKIAFRNLTVYLTPSSGFYDARFYSIQSTIDIFGDFSAEHKAVTNAWYAVGVGSEFQEYVIIPDNNFENYLEANSMGDGIALNDTVLYQNIYMVTLLDVDNQSIADLTGIESFISIENLDCSHNNLDTLIVNDNTSLISLDCSNNQLNTLDISDNNNLIQLYSDSNYLTSLYLRNGSNTNITNSNFLCVNNPNLTCIDVDDTLWAVNNWTNIDAQHYFGINCPGGYGCTDTIALNYDPSNTIEDGSCNYGLTYVPDTIFQQVLIDLGIDTDSLLNDSVSTNAVRLVTYLDLYNKNIVDLTGIEDFVILEYLNCGSNPLYSLNLSNNIALEYLNCYNNQLTNLDVSQNTDLDYLDCRSNYLDTLDVSANTALTYLNCGSNPLYSLNLSNNIALEYLNCYNNQLTNLDVSQNTDLDYLYCRSNYLYTLDVSANTALTYLDCGFNSLDTLGVSTNTALTTLNCYNNQLTNLDVSQNTDLDYLYCNNNQLDTLDVSANTALTNLQCSYNQLTSLDVSANTALTSLNCYYNNLTSLDVSINTALTGLNCRVNYLTSLNVSANTNLIFLVCYNNQLTSLDLRNGNNTNMYTYSSYLNFTGNPQLYCIDVDDVAWADTNWTTSNGNISYWNGFSNNCATAIYGCTDSLAFNYDPSATLNYGCNYGKTYVPDVNFQQALIDLGIDSDSLINDTVATASIKFLTYLNIAYESISDLTGIEDFDSLQTLYCYGNQLTTLDVSNNTVLTYLDCNNNQLTTLDLSINTALTYLDCHNNQLTTLDVSNNTALQTLSCGYNQLTNLDVSQNTDLAALYCYTNQLTSLDVSNNTNLGYFDCGYNQLTSLDVSSNTNLRTLECYNNQLTVLDIRNGNNTNMYTQSYNLNLRNNIQLYCIEVDDANYSTANWTVTNGNIDSTMSFSINCFYGCTDSLAINYNVLALNNDGSCCFISGCTDLIANNYNASACFDDSSCTYIYIFGCTDSTDVYYDPSATIDDGSCCSFSDSLIFTTCSQSGMYGPTQTQIDAEYTGTNLDSKVIINTQGIQEWVVPITGTYTISCYGAQGGLFTYSGNEGGLGAKTSGDFQLSQGEIINILVGQEGGDALALDKAAPGGGGGTFVWKNLSDSLLVAAGGGGGGSGLLWNLRHGSNSSFGSNSSDGVLGGLAGNGGQSNCSVGQSYWAGGGAGWYSDGTGGNNCINYDYNPAIQGAEGGRSPLNGGHGGYRYIDANDEGGDGGFGGGGGGGSDNMGTGGGGGFSGGAGASGTGAIQSNGGGGGGSYNIGTSPMNLSGIHDGSGLVIISYNVSNIVGCTDSSAYNYDSLAVCDDGGCVYCVIGYSTFNYSTCGTPFEWNDSIYTQTGIYTFDTINVNGCDSTATLNLTINPSTTTSTSSTTACDNLVWNGVTYLASGVYTYSTTNANGCDSIATLNLIINYSNTDTSSVAACDTYTWEGQTVTSSQVLTHTYLGVNAVGCDSTHTLIVTINNSNTGSSSVTACDTYTWEGQTVTSSQVLTHTYLGINAVGCDSTHALSVTINYFPITSTILGNTQTTFLSQETYIISQSIGSVFNWQLSGGNIISGQNTNVLDVLWGNTSGTYTLYVIETDINGCIGDTVFFSVTIGAISNIENQIPYTYKKVIRITDVLGQETPQRRNTPLFYIYDDGTVEKRIVID